ncbi:MAG: hypothetical protein JWM77_2361, partial [Rhodospirillales bacterium]|nr:hypothetical protein [Rhodospirillales bacterium]
ADVERRIRRVFDSERDRLDKPWRQLRGSQPSWR